MARVKNLTPLSEIDTNILKGSKVAKKTIPQPTIPRKKFVPGKALRDIRYYQTTTKLLLRKAPFIRLSRKTVYDITGTEFKFQKSALRIIQESLERFLVVMFEEAHLLSVHTKRKTLFMSDLKLIYRIKYSEVVDSDSLSK